MQETPVRAFLKPELRYLVKHEKKTPIAIISGAC